MRKLFGNRDPSLFERVRTMAQHEGPPPTPDKAPVGLASAEIAEAADALRRDGYTLLRARLDEDACAALEACARLATCSMEPSPSLPPLRERFCDDAPRAIRYDLDEVDIINCAAAQQLLADASLFAIAERYLGASPIQDLLAMWWSAALGTGASSAAAQEFHFDLGPDPV
jgi:hypothetical protein